MNEQWHLEWNLCCLESQDSSMGLRYPVNHAVNRRAVIQLLPSHLESMGQVGPEGFRKGKCPLASISSWQKGRPLKLWSQVMISSLLLWTFSLASASSNYTGNLLICPTELQLGINETCVKQNKSRYNCICSLLDLWKVLFWL